MFINEIIALLTILQKWGKPYYMWCGLVSWERERRNKVGIRATYLYVLAPCIFTIASFLASQYYSLSDRLGYFTIVTGIGFLGLRCDNTKQRQDNRTYYCSIYLGPYHVEFLCGMGLTNNQ